MLNLSALDFKLHYNISAQDMQNPIFYALCMMNYYGWCLSSSSLYYFVEAYAYNNFLFD